VDSPRSNPFSTRYTRPGCIPPLDAAGQPIDAATLVDRLAVLGGRAALVGPHGSGKSTLLTHIADAVERGGGRAWQIRFRSWRDLALVRVGPWRAAGGGVLCVDGWESAGPLGRLLVRLAARSAGCGLIVTAHRVPAGLPVLVRCETSPALLRALVTGLLGGTTDPVASRHHADIHDSGIRAADVDDAFQKHGGNLRESLYDLYDRFEARRPGMPIPRPDGHDGHDGRGVGGLEIHEPRGGFSYAGAPERNLR
jgi:energy-coupling factor transporter ATP-binding protein EcfA2